MLFICLIILVVSVLLVLTQSTYLPGCCPVEPFHFVLSHKKVNKAVKFFHDIQYSSSSVSLLQTKQMIKYPCDAVVKRQL